MRLLPVCVLFAVLLLCGCVVHARAPERSVTVVKPVPAAPSVVVIKRRPPLRPIRGTKIYWYAGPGYDIYFVGGYYYLYRGGMWYRSASWRGPWVHVRYLPRVFLTVPRTHPRYHIIIRFTLR